MKENGETKTTKIDREKI